jgi:hypothetical protein
VPEGVEAPALSVTANVQAKPLKLPADRVGVPVTICIRPGVTSVRREEIRESSDWVLCRLDESGCLRPQGEATISFSLRSRVYDPAILKVPGLKLLSFPGGVYHQSRPCLFAPT